MSFVQAVFYELNPHTRFKPSFFLELLAGKLEACRRGEIKRLIINLPPRSLKSLMISVAFPAWLLGHRPGTEIMCASYGQELADKLARDTRRVMASAWYCVLFSTRLAERIAVHDFETEQKGGRFATSVGGSPLGRGGDFIILDDPMKPEEALSETQRTNVKEWYDNTLSSRLNDKEDGCIIIVMQRLHQDDLVGHVLERGEWEVISFPAIAEADEEYVVESPLGSRIYMRCAGEPLHPERESLDTLAKLRKQVGEYNFNAQYQQSPMPPGGAVIKTDWLRYYEPGSEPGRFGYIVQSWDTANKAGELNDYSVCTTWGVDGDRSYLLHVYRKRVNFPDLKRAVLEQRSRYKPHTILIEDKASGTQLIQELHRLGVNLEAYQPPANTDKLMRLYSQATAFESGNVWLPEDELWLKDYVAEITGFPGTKHDDQVDSTTQFLDHLRTRVPPMIISDEVMEKVRNMRPWPGTPGYRRRYGW
jgi:predicted phage terminase large subunit-like protein